MSLFTQSVFIKGIFYCRLFLWILVQYWLFKFRIVYSFILEISLAPSRKHDPLSYFSHGPPCTLYFQGIVFPKPCFLILICHFANSMSKTDFTLSVEHHTNSILKVESAQSKLVQSRFKPKFSCFLCVFKKIIFLQQLTIHSSEYHNIMSAKCTH